MKAAALRDSLRPHGRVASDCNKCLHFADCGGIEPELNLQQSTGRRLHPLIISGTQFLEQVAKEFVTATFLDSTPFMKTVHRQAFRSMPPTGKQRWRKSPTAPDESLDKLLADNLRCYSDWLDRRWVAVAGEIVRLPTPQRLPLAIAAS